MIFLFHHIPEGQDGDPEVSRDEGLDEKAEENGNSGPFKDLEADTTNKTIKGLQNQEGQEENMIPSHSSIKQA